MNKLGIWGIAIAAAFVVGVLSANPVVEAASGWKDAVADHETRITDLETQPAGTLVTITTSKPLTVPSDKSVVSEIALCPSGTTISGGGVSGVSNAATVIVSNLADTTQNGWKVEAKSNEAVSDNITVNAVCISFS